jgi:site-specific DNA recombinase
MAKARHAQPLNRDPLESPDTLGRMSHGAKVKRGQLSSVQKGRYGTGPAPYGYRRGNENEKPLMVDDREAEVVRMIFREYLHTRSTGKVVNFLHSKKIYTRKGNKWSRQAIAIILANRSYRGRVSYGDVETEGLHDPIIEPALFYRANALRQRKQRRHPDDAETAFGAKGEAMSGDANPGERGGGRWANP